MYKICILSSICFFLNLSAKAQNILPPTLKKKVNYYKSDTTIEVVVLFKGNYYCLKSNNQVFVINGADNKIDSSHKDNSKKIRLESLYLINDTLIGLNKKSTFYLNERNKQWTLLKKGLFIPPIYEDDSYIVTSTCSGEWGGSVYFRSRKTNKLYECAAQCAVNVIKTENGYNITASIAHGMGFTNIFEIKNPLDLKPYNRDYLKAKKIIYVGDDESKSLTGTHPLVDSAWIIALTSFKYHSTIYYLTGNHRTASLDSIQNNKLVRIEDLTKLDVQCLYPVNRNCSGHQIYTFKNDQNTGFISIKNNLLTIYSFDWKHK